MSIKRIENRKLCRFCDGVGFDLGEPNININSMEDLAKSYNSADVILCKPCRGTGEEVDYHYEITYKGKTFIVDTLK